MSHFVAYLILTIPLLLMVTIVNPMEILWTIRHPYVDMSSEYVIKTVKVSVLLQLLKEIALLALLFGLLIHQGISAARVGFHLDNWQLNLAIGTTAGSLMIGLQMFLRRLMATVKYTSSDQHLSKSSVPLGIALLFIGAMAEETWIVFCILAMTQLGGSVFFTVVLTSLIFGFGHVMLGVEVVPALALSAVPSCLLFLWRGSILPLVLYHWIGNIGVLYWQRRNVPEADKHS
jgi:membrane protease YdiL (CAAX protease family)